MHFTLSLGSVCGRQSGSRAWDRDWESFVCMCVYRDIPRTWCCLLALGAFAWYLLVRVLLLVLVVDLFLYFEALYILKSQILRLRLHLSLFYFILVSGGFFDYTTIRLYSIIAQSIFRLLFDYLDFGQLASEKKPDLNWDRGSDRKFQNLIIGIELNLKIED